MLVHEHLIIRAEINNPPVDETSTKAWVRELISDIGMKILAGPFSEYVDVPGNRGLTCVTIIETSHIAIHIWDECNPGIMQFDVYSCGELDVDMVLNKITKKFDVSKLEYKFLDRESGLNEIDI